ncbi:hypothetical protein [Salsipaludibacter albus]|uniref:hypothetical protein n=1 Tax=Salsipaludibacter albus TaxID=2849650 RepID=UPI001EE40370|nr:hypothetical protein [Salsipaludibacter albus]MBY5164501.1 hypothetical protein [Salsipaludibacter albus]
MATDDGIVRIDADGTSRPVGGVSGTVDRAWDDGAGGVVFQSGPETIGRVGRGGVATIVDMADLGPREVDDVTRTDDATVVVEPGRIVLMDVDADAGRLAFGVVYTEAGGPTPNEATAVVVSDLAGGARRELALDRTWEGSSHHAIGGGVRLANRSNETGGEVELADDSGTLSTTSYSFLGDGPGPLLGGTLDDGGERWAATTRGDDGWVLRVLDVASGAVVHEAPLADLDGGHPAVPTDFAGDTVVVAGIGGDGEGRLSVVHDLDGTQASVPGRATLAR